MRAGDLETVARLESELFTSASWSLAMLEQELNGPGRTYYVWVGALPHLPQNEAGIAACDAVLGYAGLWCAGAGSDAEVMTIGVDKAAQHAGIGRALMQALMDAAREQGARRMLLEVRVDNAPAKSLYHQLGFKPMGLRKHYYQPEDVDAVTMSLNLEETEHE
jgi:ribosomal-protein-alanine N-acetyltransferase